MQAFPWDSDAGIGDLHFHGAIRTSGADFEHSALRHRVARIHEKIQEHLLEAICGAEHGREIFLQLSSNLHVGRLEGMRNQGKRFLHHGLRFTSPNCDEPVREKFSKLLTISLARKVCFTIFSINVWRGSSVGNCFASI